MGIKKELKSGMVVEHRNGDRGLVVGERIVDTDGFIYLDDFDDNLKCWSYSYDIVAIYENISSLYGLYSDELNTLWVRKPQNNEGFILKDGMVVEHRNGERGVVVGDLIIDIGGFRYLSDYNEKFEHCDGGKFDIIRVYSDIQCLDDLYSRELNLIWERV